MDDVAVFTGTRLVPVFDAARLLALKPLIDAGIRVERKVVLVYLIQSAHPLLLAAVLPLGSLFVVLAHLLA